MEIMQQNQQDANENGEVIPTSHDREGGQEGHNNVRDEMVARALNDVAGDELQKLGRHDRAFSSPKVQKAWQDHYRAAWNPKTHDLQEQYAARKAAADRYTKAVKKYEPVPYDDINSPETYNYIHNKVDDAANAIEALYDANPDLYSNMGVQEFMKVFQAEREQMKVINETGAQIARIERSVALISRGHSVDPHDTHDTSERIGYKWLDGEIGFSVFGYYHYKGKQRRSRTGENPYTGRALVDRKSSWSDAEMNRRPASGWQLDMIEAGAVPDISKELNDADPEIIKSHWKKYREFDAKVREEYLDTTPRQLIARYKEFLEGILADERTLEAQQKDQYDRIVRGDDHGELDVEINT